MQACRDDRLHVFRIIQVLKDYAAFAGAETTPMLRDEFFLKSLVDPDAIKGPTA